MFTSWGGIVSLRVCNDTVMTGDREDLPARGVPHQEPPPAVAKKTAGCRQLPKEIRLAVAMNRVIDEPRVNIRSYAGFYRITR